MKTIIKYELVINEALRSALNYHTPDEQINEFIRFFGRHIGSDRIYIFEDCKERHGTDNTYEWCAQGVVPEIGRLQNVNMDIIKWWYDTFSKGESIIITDIEDIKEEHRMSYDMLKVQNVRNVVVCPLRYKDEISGFFGVDNPPKSDYKGLTTFLDMIGTLLISFLKMRNSFIKSNKSDTYVLMVPKDDTVTEEKLLDELEALPQMNSITALQKMIGPAIPTSSIPEELLKKLQSEKYDRTVMNVSADYEGKETFALVKKSEKLQNSIIQMNIIWQAKE